MGGSISGAPGSARHQPILIDDDDNDDAPTTNLYDAIELDDNDIDAPDDEVEIISVRERTFDNDIRWGALPQVQRRRPTKKAKKAFVAYEPRTKPLSNISVLEGHWMDEVDHILLPGQIVELREDPAAPFKCGDFLQIQSIYEDLDTGCVYLRGILYRRTRTLDGMLPKKLNEIYKVLQYNMEDPRPIEVQSLHDVPVEQAIGTRCLRHTNAPFPENSFRTTEDMSGRSKEFLRSKAQLTCRWKRSFDYACAMDLAVGHAKETAIERITEDECSPGFGISDVKLRRAVAKVESDISTVDLTAEEAFDKDTILLAEQFRNTHVSSPPPAPEVPYSFADFFCGAGGVSIGARAAGMRVKYGVDHDADACATIRLNLPGTEIYEEDIYYNLTVRKQANAHVRCCHMSSVCKTISPAYTVRGKNHDANEATLFCISDILRKATPMVATLEQTFGALGGSKKQIFNAFVWQFTSMSYSVRWALHDLSEFGVPQARKRLIIMAACPGHPLPPFPTPTHGEGLRPVVTIADAIRPLRPGMPNHNPAAMDRKNFPPYDPNQQVRGCITTSGGIGNSHPSGQRHFTEREFACLQTFPLDHVFVGNRSSVIRQVGNAVPPAFSTKLYEGIRKTFEEVDLQEAAYDAEMLLREGGLQNPIELDLDDDAGEIAPGAEFMDLTV